MELVLRRMVDEVFVPDDAEFIAEIEDILKNEQVRSMSGYIQHGTTSCLSHVIAVAYLSYKTCKKLKLNARSAARGAMLHDMFLYDWHKHYDETGNRFHGLTHPQVSLANAEKEFHLSDMEKDIIVKHMWPLTPVPPRYKESFIIVYYDKLCSTRETLGKPLF